MPSLLFHCTFDILVHGSAISYLMMLGGLSITVNRISRFM